MTALSFRSRLGWCWLVVAGGLGVGVRLLFTVWWGYQAGVYVPGSRWLVLIPAALAVPILLGSLRLWWVGGGQEVRLGSTDFRYLHRGYQAADRWERVLVDPGPWRIHLTNGHWRIRLDRAFFPDFPTLLTLLTERRAAARHLEESVLAR